MEAHSAAKQSDVVALVNISTEKWPPRHRIYFGSLEIVSPQPGEAFAITPIPACLGVMDLGDDRARPLRRISYIMLTTKSAKPTFRTPP